MGTDWHDRHCPSAVPAPLKNGRRLKKGPAYRGRGTCLGPSNVAKLACGLNRCCLNNGSWPSHLPLRASLSSAYGPARLPPHCQGKEPEWPWQSRPKAGPKSPSAAVGRGDTLVLAPSGPVSVPVQFGLLCTSSPPCSPELSVVIVNFCQWRNTARLRPTPPLRRRSHRCRRRRHRR